MVPSGGLRDGPAPTPAGVDVGVGGGIAGRLQRLVLVVVLVAAAVFVAVHRDEAAPTWQAVRRADLHWVVLAVACAGVWAFLFALLHHQAQRAVGLEPAPMSQLLAAAVAAHFMNLVTKSAALAGLVAFDGLGRARGQSRGKVAGAYLVAALLAEWAFGVFLVAALVVDASAGHLNHAETATAGAFACYTSVRVVILLVGTADPDRARRLWAAPGRWWARARRLPAPATPAGTAPVAAIDDLCEAVRLVGHRPRALLPPAAAALGLQLAGLAMLWCALAAVHAPRAEAAAVVGYGVSTLFAIIGLVPSGLGFVEISLGSVVVSFGSPLATAAAGVAIYRLGALWLPVAAGAVTVRTLRHRGRL